jgi:hypothetical protein
MPQFVIERDVPGVHKLTDSEVRAVAQKSVEALTSLGPQIQWVQSYVTENKIYCVYMAPDEATIREHAKRAGVPADRVAAVRRLLSTLDGERGA